MRFVDFFAGIGGIRLGLEQAGHKCVGFCEFDKYARTAYKAMYDTEGEWESHDVRATKSYDVPAADLWCFGFPCQDISVAGKHAVQVTKRDYEYYDLLLVMDSNNIRNLRKVIGEDTQDKVHLLLDYTERKGASIADPWYTGDFEVTYDDIMEGLEGLLKYLKY